MRFRLLAPHVIRDRWCGTGEVVDDPPAGASPLMEGLDDAGKAAVDAEMLRVFGRYPGVPHGFPTSMPLLDNPPIRRPLDDNQPEFHFSGTPEYSS
jgi:hypothetical protein